MNKIRTFFGEMAGYCTLEGDADHDEASSILGQNLSDSTTMPFNLSVKVRSVTLIMSIGVSGGPEFVFAIYLRHRRLTLLR